MSMPTTHDHAEMDGLDRPRHQRLPVLMLIMSGVMKFNLPDECMQT